MGRNETQHEATGVTFRQVPQTALTDFSTDVFVLLYLRSVFKFYASVFCTNLFKSLQVKNVLNFMSVSSAAAFKFG